MNDPVTDRMRADWDARAREDAHYYVAFGRRDQNSQEFFDTGADVVRSLAAELRRLPPDRTVEVRRALEIGCGPGRLLHPMSRYFGEIHGVDVSPEMIDRARRNLNAIPHAHAHAGSGCDLKQFASESFDFIYSYAVFQHIPSRDVIFGYLREAARVARPGAVLRLQVSGLPPSTHVPNTWHGATVSVDELHQYARDEGLRLLAIEGARTQYLWATFQKPPISLSDTPMQIPARIRRVTSAASSEPAVPSGGPLAAVSLWVERLTSHADLLSLNVSFDGQPGVVSFIGPPDAGGLRQVNAFLPAGLRTGLLPVVLTMQSPAVQCEAWLRVLPPPPMVPRIMSIVDGINLLEKNRIVSGLVKVTLEEATSLEGLEVMLDNAPVEYVETFLIDPLVPRWEINFRLPKQHAAGERLLQMTLKSRRFPSVTLRVEPLH